MTNGGKRQTKFRKTGVIIMALIMIISLTGCGYEMSIHITKDNIVKTTIISVH